MACVVCYRQTLVCLIAMQGLHLTLLSALCKTVSSRVSVVCSFNPALQLRCISLILV